MERMKYNSSEASSNRSIRLRGAIEIAKGIVAGALIGGALASGYEKGTKQVFDYRAKDAKERIKIVEDEEREVRKMFGSYSPMHKAGNLTKDVEQARGRYYNPFRSIDVKDGFEAVSKPESLPETGDIFAKDGRMDKKDLDRYLGTYPKGWQKNLASINQENKNQKLTASGLGSSGNALATTFRHGDGGKDSLKAKVVFWDVTRNGRFGYVVDSISHELGHVNDWNDEGVSYVDRLELLVKIGQRINAKDRFHSAYVESIHEDNHFRVAYDRATEYWSEICVQYFNDATQLHVKDFGIVDDYVHKIDSKYNWKSGNTARSAVLAEIISHHTLPSTPIIAYDYSDKQK